MSLKGLQRQMSKLIKLFIIVATVGLISACSISTFTSDVSRFHELPLPHGETVVIVAAGPAQNTSLEFASYANIVGSYLAQQGYAPANGGKAALVVELVYSADGGKVKVMGRSYSGSSSYRYGYGYGSLRSSVEYTRKLTRVIRPNVEGTIQS